MGDVALVLPVLRQVSTQNPAAKFIVLTKDKYSVFFKGFEEFEIIKDARINELDFGKFEGKSYREIKKSYPKECTQWEDDWKGFTPPKGESAVNFFKRVKSFMEDIEKLDEENILIATHGGVIKMIYCYMLDRNLDLYWKFSTKNGGVSLIKYEYSNWFIDYIS